MTKKITVSVLMVILLVPAFVLAAPLVRTSEKVSIDNSERVSDDAYLAGGMLTMAGNVAGDFIGAGGNIFVTGSTTNDVTVAGGLISVMGSVGDDLRIAGGDITILSSIGDDVVVAGGQVKIVSGAVIGGDLIVAGGQVVIDGTVRGAVRVVGGDVSINGTTGSVFSKSESIVIGPNAKINGVLNYSAVKQAEIKDGSVISGAVTFTEIKRAQKSAAGFFSIALLVKFIALFVTALIFQWLLGRIAVRIVSDSLTGVWGNLGRGFVALIIIPIAIIILLATVIGIPLALIALFAYIALIVFACLFVAVFAGGLISKYYKKSELTVLNWKTALVGSLVTTLVAFIPIVGGIVMFIIFLIVLGGIVKVKMQYLKNLRQTM